MAMIRRMEAGQDMGRWREFIDFVRNRGEPAGGASDFREPGDREREEAVNRVYELHLWEKNLFYIDTISLGGAWENGGKDAGKMPGADGGNTGESKEVSMEIVGEVAKGNFQPGDTVDFFDKDANPLTDGQFVIFKAASSARGLAGSTTETVLSVGGKGDGDALLSAQFLTLKPDQRHCPPPRPLPSSGDVTGRESRMERYKKLHGRVK